MNSLAHVRLGDLLVERNDVVHPRDCPTGDAVFVGLEHVEPHTGRRIGQLPVDMATLTGRKPRFRAGDLVYGYLRPYLNKLWVAEFDGLCSVDPYVYTVRLDVADAAYVAWFMRSPQYLAAMSAGRISSPLPRIRRDEVAAVQVRLLPLAEQRRLAARLSAAMAEVARARMAATERVTAAAALSSALQRELFGDATERPLGELVSPIESGKSLQCEERPALPEELGVLKASAVSWGRLRPEENKVLPAVRRVEPHHRVGVGDLLMSRSNTGELVGAVVYVRATPPNLLLSDKTLRLRPRPDLASPQFLELALRSPAARRFIETEATGSSTSMRNLSQEKIGRIPVPWVPTPEQQEWVDRVDLDTAAVEQVRAALAGKLAAMDALPARILAGVFGGGH